jgi:hypothetical protein
MRVRVGGRLLRQERGGVSDPRVSDGSPHEGEHPETAEPDLLRERYGPSCRR